MQLQFRISRRKKDIFLTSCTFLLSFFFLQSARSQSITYPSSVDGEPLTAVLSIPPNFDPEGAAVPLVVWLHGGGSTGAGIRNGFQGQLGVELDARGWIGIGPDGRQWGLSDPALCPNNPNASGGCPWCTSAAYFDSPDPAVGPGQQDILDAIDWVVANLPIDTDRIYLAGFSFGGRGTFMIGLRNPDRFAAIAPMAPSIDMYEIFERLVAKHLGSPPAACELGVMGGQPGDSPFIDTMYKSTSGRFLIENAYNLPVFHGHGLLDDKANNDPANAPFLHGWHITSDTSWDGCHGDPALDFCFGHTPTLSELRDRHPQGYDWAFMFTPVGHTPDRKWLKGTPATPGIEGVEDPQNPGNLIGMMEFLSRHTLVRDPETVVYKTYTDTHRKAYWTEIDITTPWQNIPGAIRATRSPAENALQVELVRVDTVAFDLELAGLAVSDAQSLRIVVDVLDEPVFDPALDAAGEALEPTVVLRGDFSNIAEISVLADGTPLDETLFSLSVDEIAFGPVTIQQSTMFTIQATNVTSVDSGDRDAIPDRFVLEQNYPNPFNPSTTIRFSLPQRERVVLKVFDFLGREVATLLDEELPVGDHSVVFDAKGLTSGVYFFRVTAGPFTQIRKALLMK